MPDVRTTTSVHKMKKLVKQGWTLQNGTPKMDSFRQLAGLQFQTVFTLTRPSKRELRKAGK